MGSSGYNEQEKTSGKISDENGGEGPNTKNQPQDSSQYSSQYSSVHELKIFTACSCGLLIDNIILLNKLARSSMQAHTPENIEETPSISVVEPSQIARGMHELEAILETLQEIKSVVELGSSSSSFNTSDQSRESATSREQSRSGETRVPSSTKKPPNGRIDGSPYVAIELCGVSLFEEYSLPWVTEGGSVGGNGTLHIDTLSDWISTKLLVCVEAFNRAVARSHLGLVIPSSSFTPIGLQLAQFLRSINCHAIATTSASSTPDLSNTLSPMDRMEGIEEDRDHGVDICEENSALEVDRHIDENCDYTSVDLELHSRAESCVDRCLVAIQKLTALKGREEVKLSEMQTASIPSSSTYQPGVEEFDSFTNTNTIANSSMNTVEGIEKSVQFIHAADLARVSLEGLGLDKLCAALNSLRNRFLEVSMSERQKYEKTSVSAEKTSALAASGPKAAATACMVQPTAGCMWRSKTEINAIDSSVRWSVECPTTHHLLVLSTLPLVKDVIVTANVLLTDLCTAHKSMGKLLYVTMRIFRTLLAKGN